MNALEWTIANKKPLPWGKIITLSGPAFGHQEYRVESHKDGVYRLRDTSTGAMMAVMSDHRIFINGQVNP